MATVRRKDEAAEVPWERLVREDLPTYPEFAKLASQRSWDELDDLWLESVTGEPIPPHHRAPRDSDL